MTTRRPRPATTPRSAFVGFGFPPEVIASRSAGTCATALYRDVEELLVERGVDWRLFITKRALRHQAWGALAVLRFGESATCRRSVGVVMPGAPARRPRRCETPCGAFAVILSARR